MSKLTKENCLKALKSMHSITFDVDTGEYKTLKQLINKHFDNPPLSYEDIQTGEWYWDNKYKEWILIDCHFGEHCFELVAYCKSKGIRRWEPNRFYKKQVK